MSRAHVLLASGARRPGRGHVDVQPHGRAEDFDSKFVTTFCAAAVVSVTASSSRNGIRDMSLLDRAEGGGQSKPDAHRT